MVYSTEELADATVALKPTLDKSMSWKAAAKMAIRRKGISNPSDLARRATDVVKELNRRSKLTARRNRARATHTHQEV